MSIRGSGRAIEGNGGICVHKGQWVGFRRVIGGFGAIAGSGWALGGF